jgi:hypothetical protein
MAFVIEDDDVYSARAAAATSSDPYNFDIADDGPMVVTKTEKAGTKHDRNKRTSLVTSTKTAASSAPADKAASLMAKYKAAAKAKRCGF